jgi:hypothetical protein
MPTNSAPETNESRPVAMADVVVEKRDLPDRRQTPTSPWGALPPAGHRERCRRADERRLPYFVDRFSPAMLAFILMLLIASLTDAVLTIQLIDAGGVEINPLMDRLLVFGTLPFVFGKYLLTVVGLPVLLVFKNHYLFGTRFRVGHLIPVVVALYAVLIGYQIVLMQWHAE